MQAKHEAQDKWMLESGEVVTGMGVWSPIGTTVEAFWSSLCGGEDGIREIRSFDVEEFGIQIAGIVPENWAAQAALEGVGEVDACAGYGLLAAWEAQEMAGLRGVEGQRCALVVGTSMGGGSMSGWIGAETARIAQGLGVDGARLTVSTACTSSTHAVGLGRDLLRLDVADVVYIVGSDPLAKEAFAGFYTLGVMCPVPCAPFSLPEGMTMGEGAGALVLERAEDAARRGAKVQASLLGYGLSCDAFHPTTPDPSGKGLAFALESACEDAGVAPGEVGYYNAHGTGTQSNDAAEWRAVQRVFGQRASSLPVSSTKGHFGHAQGATGVLEVIASILAMQAQVVLPTLHFTQPRKQTPTDPVAQRHPRPASYEVLASNNSAFGGLNAVLLVGRKPHGQDARGSSGLREDVLLCGVGAVAAHGCEGLLTALEAGHALRHGPPAQRSFSEGCPAAGFVPGVDAKALGRGGERKSMDPVTRFLTAATTQAITASGFKLRGALRRKAGLFVGTSRAPAQSSKRYVEIANERGWSRAPTHEFARIVLNAPAGACALTHSLRGPGVTLAGAHSGLFATIVAYEWLATRPETALMLAGGVDELGEDELAQSVMNDEHFVQEAGCLLPGSETVAAASVRRALGQGSFLGEGAGMVLLAKRSFCEEQGRKGGICVRGASLGGPGEQEAVLARILGQAQGPLDALFVCTPGLSPEEVEARFVGWLGSAWRGVPVWEVTQALGLAPAASGALTLVAAAACLGMGFAREGVARGWGLDKMGGMVRQVLVWAEDETGGCGGCWLEAEGALG